MVMERLADFVSKSLEGGAAPTPPPEPGEPDADEEVDITALEEKAPPAKRPRNWLISPLPLRTCKKETDDDDDARHGRNTTSVCHRWRYDVIARHYILIEYRDKIFIQN